MMSKPPSFCPAITTSFSSSCSSSYSSPYTSSSSSSSAAAPLPTMPPRDRPASRPAILMPLPDLPFPLPLTLSFSLETDLPLASSTENWNWALAAFLIAALPDAPLVLTRVEPEPEPEELPARFSMLRLRSVWRSSHQVMVLEAPLGATGAFSSRPSSCLSCASVSEPRDWPVTVAENASMTSDEGSSERAALPNALALCFAGWKFSLKKGEASAPAAVRRSVGLYAMSEHSSSHPAPSSRSSSSKPSANPFLPSSSSRQRRRSQLSASRRRLNAMMALSERSAGNAICSSVTPHEYMSKRSGFSMRHSTGDRKAATGLGGGRGVCVDMTYCWGGA
mmetsp:Transcript_25927/g.65984  ORF Transcript_25927/g.65984 Transcript_25927/m.65984 type:complete len:336 (-) Transcript_25927:1184-2191(-)